MANAVSEHTLSTLTIDLPILTNNKTGKGKGGDSRRLGSDSEDYSLTEEHHNGVRARRFLESLDFDEEEPAMDNEYDTLREFVDENYHFVHD